MAERETTDRRVRKTRRRLRQGLVKLMESKSVQEITVKELCEECDINRGTFYLHYRDVHELLGAIEAELLGELDEMLARMTPDEMTGRTCPGPTMRALFAFLAQNADMCRVFLCNNGDKTFMERVRVLVRRRVMGIWEELFRSEQKDLYEYVFSFMVAGGIGMLQHWLESGTRLSPEEMAAMTERILVQGILAFGEPPAA